MSRTSLLNKSAEDNLTTLCKTLDDLLAYKIIHENKLLTIEEILFGLHGPDDESYEDAETASISSLYETCEDKFIFIQDLRNAIRHVLSHHEINVNDAISEIIDSREL